MVWLYTGRDLSPETLAVFFADPDVISVERVSSVETLVTMAQGSYRPPNNSLRASGSALYYVSGNSRILVDDEAVYDVVLRAASNTVIIRNSDDPDAPIPFWLDSDDFQQAPSDTLPSGSEVVILENTWEFARILPHNWPVSAPAVFLRPEDFEQAPSESEQEQAPLEPESWRALLRDRRSGDPSGQRLGEDDGPDVPFEEEDFAIEARNPNGSDVPVWNHIEGIVSWTIPNGTRVQVDAPGSTHTHVTFAFEGARGQGYIPNECLPGYVAPDTQVIVRHDIGAPYWLDQHEAESDHIGANFGTIPYGTRGVPIRTEGSVSLVYFPTRMENVYLRNYDLQYVTPGSRSFANVQTESPLIWMGNACHHLRHNEIVEVLGVEGHNYRIVSEQYGEGITLVSNLGSVWYANLNGDSAAAIRTLREDPNFTPTSTPQRSNSRYDLLVRDE